MWGASAAEKSNELLLHMAISLVGVSLLVLFLLTLASASSSTHVSSLVYFAAMAWLGFRTLADLGAQQIAGVVSTGPDQNAEPSVAE